MPLPEIPLLALPTLLLHDSLRSVTVDAPLCRCSSLPSLQNPNPLTPSAPLLSCFLLLVSPLLCKLLSKSDGYVVTKPRMTKTSDEAQDDEALTSRDKKYRQAITAAGSGSNLTNSISSKLYHLHHKTPRNLLVFATSADGL
ncbi:hypothetical protein Ahy_A04g020719 [Arachis hypogaea]|uniref:Uncharacterized protein n=1 Tax=Arachis hypogaea TaxID=3818 RepID=A0A445DIC3_ARAHY|nr:hypothetical protein Ahy_A04g020719 [Arachis hypogaea]